MTFQEKLYRLRKERGLSQERLARELGVSRQAISRWELGEVVPDTANVLALCRVFGVAADTLLREDLLSAREPEPADGETEPESGVTAGSTDPEEAEDLQAEEERRKREKQELQRDILRTNLGLIVRYAELAAFVALHSWLATDEPSWLFSFLVWFVLSLTGVIWWNHGWYLREGGSRALLGWDTLTVVLAAFIPRMLSGLPGIWGILPGVIPGALVVVGPIRTLLLDHYRVEPPGRRKES